MGFEKHTVGISRTDLAMDWLREIRIWPGCEMVEGVGGLVDLRRGFSVHIINYGRAKKKLADQAARCVQREKIRRYHLTIE